MIRTFAALAVLALAPGVASGQAPAQPAPAGQGRPQSAPAARPAAKPATPVVAPAARGLAQALTTREAWDDILDGYANGLSGQIAGALSATGKEAPPELREEVRRELGEAVSYDQAVDMQARALAGRFSSDELRTLETFYRSGPGRKLLDALPEIASQVNDELRARLSERVPGIVERHAPSIAAAPEGDADAAPRPPKVQGQTPPRDSAPGRGSTGSTGSGDEGTPPVKEK
jgi:hypothetical protein